MGLGTQQCEAADWGQQPRAGDGGLKEAGQSSQSVCFPQAASRGEEEPTGKKGGHRRE